MPTAAAAAAAGVKERLLVSQEKEPRVTSGAYAYLPCRWLAENESKHACSTDGDASTRAHTGRECQGNAPNLGQRRRQRLLLLIAGSQDRRRLLLLIAGSQDRRRLLLLIAGSQDRRRPDGRRAGRPGPRQGLVWWHGPAGGTRSGVSRAPLSECVRLAVAQLAGGRQGRPAGRACSQLRCEESNHRQTHRRRGCARAPPPRLPPHPLGDCSLPPRGLASAASGACTRSGSERPPAGPVAPGVRDRRGLPRRRGCAGAAEGGPAGGG